MMRAWPIISFSSALALAAIACGGESTTVAAGTSGASGTQETSAGASGAAGDSSGAAGDSSGVAGSSNGGAAGSNGTSGSGGGETADASSGSGGGAKDASVTADGSNPVRDAASERTAVDGACAEGTTDRCDTCTDARCCAQIDACEANAACKAAFAKIDACVGDGGNLNRIRNCYLAFEATNGTNGTARNLGQCVANRCTNQCRL